MDIHPLRNDKELLSATEEINRLWGAAQGTPERERFDGLGVLVKAYEREHYPIDPPEPIDAIRFRMEQEGFAMEDLENRSALAVAVWRRQRARS